MELYRFRGEALPDRMHFYRVDHICGKLATVRLERINARILLGNHGELVLPVSNRCVNRLADYLVMADVVTMRVAARIVMTMVMLMFSR
jgi:hypothetical protein